MACPSLSSPLPSRPFLLLPATGCIHAAVFSPSLSSCIFTHIRYYFLIHSLAIWYLGSEELRAFEQSLVVIAPERPFDARQESGLDQKRPKKLVDAVTRRIHLLSRLDTRSTTAKRSSNKQTKGTKGETHQLFSVEDVDQVPGSLATDSASCLLPEPHSTHTSRHNEARQDTSADGVLPVDHVDTGCCLADVGGGAARCHPPGQR